MLPRVDKIRLKYLFFFISFIISQVSVSGLYLSADINSTYKTNIKTGTTFVVSNSRLISTTNVRVDQKWSNLDNFW